MSRAIVAVVLLLFPFVASAGWFGPSTYDECILENMKGVGSDLAARVVMGICQRKFPSPAPKPVAKVERSPCDLYREDYRNGKKFTTFVLDGCVPISKEEQRKLKAAGLTNFTPIPDDGK